MGRSNTSHYNMGEFEDRIVFISQLANSFEVYCSEEALIVHHLV